MTSCKSFGWLMQATLGTLQNGGLWRHDTGVGKTLYAREALEPACAEKTKPRGNIHFRVSSHFVEHTFYGGLTNKTPKTQCEFKGALCSCPSPLSYIEVQLWKKQAFAEPGRPKPYCPISWNIVSLRSWSSQNGSNHTAPFRGKHIFWGS